MEPSLNCPITANMVAAPAGLYKYEPPPVNELGQEIYRTSDGNILYYTNGLPVYHSDKNFRWNKNGTVVTLNSKATIYNKPKIYIVDGFPKAFSFDCKHELTSGSIIKLSLSAMVIPFSVSGNGSPPSPRSRSESDQGVGTHPTDISSNGVAGIPEPPRSWNETEGEEDTGGASSCGGDGEHEDDGAEDEDDVGGNDKVKDEDGAFAYFRAMKLRSIKSSLDILFANGKSDRSVREKCWDGTSRFYVDLRNYIDPLWDNPEELLECADALNIDYEDVEEDGLKVIVNWIYSGADSHELSDCWKVLSIAHLKEWGAITLYENLKSSKNIYNFKKRFCGELKKRKCELKTTTMKIRHEGKFRGFGQHIGEFVICGVRNYDGTADAVEWIKDGYDEM